MDGRVMSFDEAMGGQAPSGDRSGAKPIETISSQEAKLRQQSGGYGADGKPAARVAAVDTESTDPSLGKFPPTGTLISLEQALGAKSGAPLADKVTKTTPSGTPGILSAPKDWWDRFSQHIAESKEEFYGQWANAGVDFKASERDPALGLKSAGEGLLAVASLAWGQTGGAAYKTVVGDPITAVSKKIPAADDLHPIDPKTKQFSKSGDGFTINREDIDQQTQHINDFLETLSGFAELPGAGLKGPPAGTLDALTPEARAAFKARQESTPRKAEGAFETLISKSPEGAIKVADKIAEISPETAKYLHDKIKQFTDASEEELGLIGRKAAEANIKELEGSMPKDYTQYVDPDRVSTGEGSASTRGARGKRASGQDPLIAPTARGPLGEPLNEAGANANASKPPEAPPARVPSVTNEQVGAGLRVAGRDLYTGLLDDPYRYGGIDMSQPKEVRAIQREGVAAMRRREMDIGDDFANEIHPKDQHFASIDNKMYPHYSELEDARFPTSSHDLLDRMKEHADTPFQKELISKLRSKVGDVKIHFEDAVEDAKGKLVAGTYKHSTGTIRVGMNHNYQTGTVMHELVHAGTVKFLVDNPAHPLTQELNRLYELTKSRIAEARADLAKHGAKSVGKDPYGMKNTFEFVAEAMTNK